MTEAVMDDPGTFSYSDNSDFVATVYSPAAYGGANAASTCTACTCANGDASTTATVCSPTQDSCASCDAGFGLDGVANAASTCTDLQPLLTEYSQTAEVV